MPTIVAMGIRKLQNRKADGLIRVGNFTAITNEENISLNDYIKLYSDSDLVDCLTETMSRRMPIRAFRMLVDFNPDKIHYRD